MQNPNFTYIVIFLEWQIFAKWASITLLAIIFFPTSIILVFQYVILFKILVLTVPNKLALQFILGSPCYSRFPPKVGYFLLLLQELHIYQQLKVLSLVLIEIPRRQQDIGSIDCCHITQLSSRFCSVDLLEKVCFV